MTDEQKYKQSVILTGLEYPSLILFVTPLEGVLAVIPFIFLMVAQHAGVGLIVSALIIYYLWKKKKDGSTRGIAFHGIYYYVPTYYKFSFPFRFEFSLLGKKGLEQKEKKRNNRNIMFPDSSITCFED